jgi:hypothetical protein
MVAAFAPRVRGSSHNICEQAHAQGELTEDQKTVKEKTRL